MKRLMDRLQRWMDDYSIRKKLLILYVVCVLFPLVLTDAVILYIVFDNEHQQQQKEFASIASAVEADLAYTFEEAIDFTNSVYINRTLNLFLEQSFSSPLEFFEESRRFSTDPFLGNMNSERFQVMFYGDNDDIVNGGLFYRLDSVADSTLFLEYQQKDRDMTVIFNYKENSINVVMIRRMNYYRDLQKEKYVVVTVDYVNLVRRFQDMRYNAPVMVCSGDRILFTNDGNLRTKIDYEYLTGKENIRLERDFFICGEPFRILIMQPSGGILPSIQDHFLLILCLILVNVLLPLALVSLINRSFAQRLGELSTAFDRMDTEEIEELEYIQGTDEISALMWNYNQMVRRMKELIQTVYKDRLEKQGIDIARQQAERLALYSQINPHFLYNTLDSIAMSARRNQDRQSEEMTHALAEFFRIGLSHGAEYVTVEMEVRYVKAYLEIQNMRFPDLLTWECSIEHGLEEIKILKFILQPLAENSIYHGFRDSGECGHIEIRVYTSGKNLQLCVSDNGIGMMPEQLEILKSRMAWKQMTEQSIQEGGFGLQNVQQRLQLVYGTKAGLHIESEWEEGTRITVVIPDIIKTHSEKEGSV